MSNHENPVNGVERVEHLENARFKDYFFFLLLFSGKLIFTTRLQKKICLALHSIASEL